MPLSNTLGGHHDAAPKTNCNGSRRSLGLDAIRRHGARGACPLAAMGDARTFNAWKEDGGVAQRHGFGHGFRCIGFDSGKAPPCHVASPRVTNNGLLISPSDGALPQATCSASVRQMNATEAGVTMMTLIRIPKRPAS